VAILGVWVVRGGHVVLPFDVVWCEEQRSTWLFDILAITPQHHSHLTSTHGDNVMEVWKKVDFQFELF
jgi:hypothetical protein